jgi:AraC-like DNA-binding protein
MAETRNSPTAQVVAPRTLFFHCEETNADTEYLPHSHDWGQVVCVKTSVIALNDVGYSSASAFIVMLQQVAGTTPERFRRA